MPLVRSQTTLPFASGLPRDSSVLTLWWGVDGTLDGTAGTEIVNRIAGAFGAWGPYISAYVPRAAGNIDVKLFDMSVPEPRPPFLPGWGFGPIPNAATNTSLPLELAICLSFTSAVGPFISARSRGRIYLGPLVSSVSSTGVAGTVPRPTSAVIDAWLDGAEVLQTVISDSRVTWQQFSPTNNAANEVTSAWVDDEFDIQRRRGAEPTARTSRTV